MTALHFLFIIRWDSLPLLFPLLSEIQCLNVLTCRLSYVLKKRQVVMFGDPPCAAQLRVPG